MSAVGIEAQIAEALSTHLVALAVTLPLDVAAPNAAYPANGSTDKPDTYLKATFLRAPTQGIGIAAWDEHAGIFQVDVLYSKLSGEIKPLQTADAVADWFKRGTRLSDGSIQVDVYEPPQIARAMPNGDGYQKIPVSIRYRSFVR